MGVTDKRGLCLVCEDTPTDEGDCMCAACRQLTTDMSSEVVDPVEVAINDHWLFTPLCRHDYQLCRCGWEIDSGPGYHRRHLAEKVYEALGLEGPVSWMDGPLVVHPIPRTSIRDVGRETTA